LAIGGTLTRLQTGPKAISSSRRARNSKLIIEEQCENSPQKRAKDNPPKGFKIDPKSTTNRPKIDPKSTENRPQIDRESTPNRPRIDPKSTEDRQKIHQRLGPNRSLNGLQML
jgi:hypothetical protein